MTKKQLDFLDDLFKYDDEKSVLKKHGVNERVYSNWRGSGEFSAEFRRRVEALENQTKLLLVKYKAYAAAKLVELTQSDKEETARKACLDIISIESGESEGLGEQVDEERIPDGMTSKLLAVLAGKNVE
ncbi:MAG: hypothetical protein H8D47_03795 [Planctomycetes bacterium]|nr:hypothetical protein [Planctomycetota bacterium]